MLTLSPSMRIWLCRQPADMRGGFDRLAAMAREHAGEDPLVGGLFLFRNRRGDRIKVLYWDRNGYAVWYKRLERGSFRLPGPEGDGASAISARVFQLVLGGAIR